MAKKVSKRILLGVTGSIAAYKAAELVRLFVKNGDEVRVVMTPAACEFVSPLTFQTLSRNPVYVEEFVAAGAQTIQLHVEADCDLHTELRRIRALGVRPAIVLNPETPVEILIPYLGEVEEVLVMTVHPGYGGQKFIPECLSKTEWLRRRSPDLDIMIDGGVNAETAPAAARAGVNMFVTGSYLFGKTDMKSAVADLRSRINHGQKSE